MSSVKEIEKCISSCHERGKKIKDNRNKIERKKKIQIVTKKEIMILGEEGFINVM